MSKLIYYIYFMMPLSVGGYCSNQLLIAPPPFSVAVSNCGAEIAGLMWPPTWFLFLFFLNEYGEPECVLWSRPGGHCIQQESVPAGCLSHLYLLSRQSKYKWDVNMFAVTFWTPTENTHKHLLLLLFFNFNVRFLSGFLVIILLL